MAKYPVTECLNILKNLWEKPEYTKLTFTSKAYLKLIAFINLIGDYEISGFARIEDVNGEAYITDVDILKQRVKGAYVEASEDAVMDFLRRIPKEQYGQWTLDWHSHVNMSTSPSGTDWNNYAEMLTARMGKQFPFMIVNKREEITAYQYMSESRHKEIKMYIDQTPMSEDDILSLYNECKEKVETLCTKEIEATVTVASNPFEKKESKGVVYSPSKNNYVSRWDQEYEYNDYYGRKWYEDDDDDIIDYCTECGKPLDTKDSRQCSWGICAECMKKEYPELL